MQQQPGFDALFNEAAVATGHRYIEVRTQLLSVASRDPSALDQLRHERGSANSRRALVASILLLRIEKAEAYQQAEACLDGGFPRTPEMERLIVADLPQRRISTAWEHLGHDLVFLGLENLFIARKYKGSDWTGWRSSFPLITSARDRRWNDILLAAIADDSYDEVAKEYIEKFLVTVKERRLLPKFRSCLKERPLPEFRAARAVWALSIYGDEGSVPRIRAIAQDHSLDAGLRIEALDALVRMRVPGAQKILLEELSAAGRDGFLATRIAEGLEEIGDRQAIPALKRSIHLVEGEDAAEVEESLRRLQARLRHSPIP